MKEQPLNYLFTEPGKASIVDAITWLLSAQGEEAANRFADKLDTVLEDLCLSVAQEIGGQGRPMANLDAEASAYFSCPVYRHLFQTGTHRQRRSSTGKWYLYYVLTATEEGTERPDTLMVYGVRHSAARPLSVETEDEET